MPGRLLVSRFAALAAVLLAALAAFYFRPESTELHHADLFMLLTGAACGLALWLRRSEAVGLPQDVGIVPYQAGPPLRRWPVAVGLLCLLVVSERSGYLLRLPGMIDTLNIHTQMLLLVGGLLLLTAGLAGLRLSDLQACVNWLRTHRTEAAALLGVTLLGLFVRTFDLEYSVHTFVDEFHLVDAINELNRNPRLAILHPFDHFAAYPWVFPYAEMLASRLFGPSMTGLRIVSALVGTLTVPALYLLARQMFDRRTALMAALLLATFPPHVHFSRLSMMLIVDPLCFLLALGCLLLALRNGQRRFYVLAGVSLGLLFYFGDAGKLLLLGLMLCWLPWLGLMGRARPPLRGLLWAAGTAALVAAPVLYTMLAQNSTPTPRLEQSGLPTAYWLAMLLEGSGVSNLQGYFSTRIMPSLLHYVHLPDQSGVYYMGHTALLLPWMVAPFLLGLWQALWRPRGVGLLLLLWLLFNALGNSLLRDPAWSARYMVVAPALVLLAAAGLRYTWPLLLRPGAAPLLRLRLPAALVLLAALVQIAYYAGPHLQAYRHQVPPWRDYPDAAFRAAELPPGTVMYVIHSEVFYGFHIVSLFEYWGVQEIYLAELHYHELPDELPYLNPARDYAFFLDPHDADSLAALRSYRELQGPFYSPYYAIPREKQYVMYLAPATEP